MRGKRQGSEEEQDSHAKRSKSSTDKDEESEDEIQRGDQPPETGEQPEKKEERPEREDDLRWEILANILRQIGQICSNGSQKLEKEGSCSSEGNTETEDNSGLCFPMENHPAAFNTLLQTLGVTGMTFIDVGFDCEVAPVVGAVVLLPAGVKTAAAGLSVKDDSICLLKQTEPSTCALVSVINILSNTQKPVEGPGSNLFKTSPEMAYQELCKRKSSPETSTSMPGTSTSMPGTANTAKYHYVAFVKIKHDAVLLDGLLQTPVIVGVCSDDTFLKVVRDSVLAVNDAEFFYPSLLALVRK